MSITPDTLRKAGERLEAIDPGLGGECFQAASTIEEMQHENELFDDDMRAKQRLIDRIADLIGLPHDQELEQLDFELWFTKNIKRNP